MRTKGQKALERNTFNKSI